MTNLLMEKFHEFTRHEFDFLRLSGADMLVREQKIVFNFIYPEDKSAVVKLKSREIESSLAAVLKSSAEVEAKFKLSHFDPEFFSARLFSHFMKYPALSTLSSGDVLADQAGNVWLVTLVMEENVYDYCNTKQFMAELDDFVALNYCETVKFVLQSKPNALALPKNEKVQTVMDDPAGRSIRPQNVEDFIGNIIYDAAGYIADARPAEGAVLCGTIGQFEEKLRKPKDELSLQKKYYKFTLSDYTGSINCIYFPSMKTAEQIKLLKNDKQIVARGKIDLDTYRNNGSLTYNVREISLCTLPKEFTENKIRRIVGETYLKVLPAPYVQVAQKSLFNDAQDKISDFLIGKTFCVFDIETTGLSPMDDRIIELGAVKIVDGKITEQFSSYIDPEMHIPERITELTSITDKDVFGAPKADEVLIDFYKFSSGTVLVGQNVSFDLGFVSVKGRPLNIYFENEVMDTLSLARQYVPTLKKFKLENLAEYFGVKNAGAHRAIYDAIATAEVFIKLTDFFSSNS